MLEVVLAAHRNHCQFKLATKSNQKYLPGFALVFFFGPVFVFLFIPVFVFVFGSVFVFFFGPVLTFFFGPVSGLVAQTAQPLSLQTSHKIKPDLTSWLWLPAHIN